MLSWHIATRSKERAEYTLNGEVMGYRYFRDDGMLGTETPLRNGLTHGNLYYFDNEPGGILKVTFAWPHRKGLPHGTARQWSIDGKLIGTFTMKHGTGWDLWRIQVHEKGSIRVSEARYLWNGKLHGFEWWFNFDGDGTIYSENHFWENLQHGIERQWNNQGKLKRGYPRYWINNQQVTKRQYLRASAKDLNLPPFKQTDNMPARVFPPEVASALKVS
ncbi:hypothetical protein ACFPT7_16150 [Acidicapsa dinghuensis]|uniref:Toxin-antitoxin system YwqK family antitoxin n=1 Tax=Acidicapsa dinghuensis TaxID=2218256 RepID=A0ABW1EHS3_9BACT